MVKPVRDAHFLQQSATDHIQYLQLLHVAFGLIQM